MRTLSVLAAGALLPAMPAAAQDWAELRNTLFDSAGELFAGEGYHALGFVHEGSLDDGGSERVTISLGADKEIFLVGICDADCSDLDMTLHDSGGDRVGSDLENDDVPIVQAIPGHAGRYSVRVQMAGCAADPCRYAIQMFTR